MKKFLLHSIVILFVSTAFTGCKNTGDRIREYVNSFNQSASKLSNDFIVSVKASQAGEKGLNIEFLTRIKDEEKDIFTQIFPSVVAAVIKEDKTLKDLINEGVDFKITFKNNENKNLFEMKVNKEKLQKILNSIDDAKGNFGNDNTSNQLKDLLRILNKDLPIVDKNTGIKITRIDINKQNELVYSAIVPESMDEALKSESAKEVMKEEILRSGNLNSVLNNIKQYNIYVIKYIYNDSKGKQIVELKFSAEDYK